MSVYCISTLFVSGVLSVPRILPNRSDLKDVPSSYIWECLRYVSMLFTVISKDISLFNSSNVVVDAIASFDDVLPIITSLSPTVTVLSYVKMPYLIPFEYLYSVRCSRFASA